MFLIKEERVEYFYLKILLEGEMENLKESQSLWEIDEQFPYEEL